MSTTVLPYLAFAEQLRVLFETKRHPDRRSFTLQEVSAGTGIAMATLSHMRTGKIKNPQLSSVRELCRFFAVPLRYFETTTLEECYAVLTADSADSLPMLNEIAFRATHLSPEAQEDILQIIKWAQTAEQSNGSDDPSPPSG
ncbi:MAG: helix-turn-helix transcriptional regulator [Chloroflexota bacterium]|nr:helix-turn-helix transcriptional regulator [Chloroflexota bacterium]